MLSDGAARESRPTRARNVAVAGAALLVMAIGAGLGVSAYRERQAAEAAQRAEAQKLEAQQVETQRAEAKKRAELAENRLRAAGRAARALQLQLGRSLPQDPVDDETDPPGSDADELKQIQAWQRLPNTARDSMRRAQAGPAQ